MKRTITIILAAIALIGFIFLGLTNIDHTNQKLKTKDIQLKSNQAELIELENKLQIELENKATTTKEREEQNQRIQQLQDEIRQKDALLEAKREKTRLEQEKLAEAARKASGTQKAYAATGNCEQWKAQAGIASTPATRALINGESGCRPNAINPSSGACGIPQALPCGKMPCTLQDPVCQLKWMNSYVASRYGSWDNAYATWLSRSPHWY